MNRDIYMPIVADFQHEKHASARRALNTPGFWAGPRFIKQLSLSNETVKNFYLTEISLALKCRTQIRLEEIAFRCFKSTRRQFTQGLWRQGVEPAHSTGSRLIHDRNSGIVENDRFWNEVFRDFSDLMAVCRRTPSAIRTRHSKPAAIPDSMYE